MTRAKQQFGRRLRTLRLKKSLTQAQMSELVDLDSKHISRLETGKAFASIETLESLAKALGVTIKDLFDFSEEKTDNVISIEDIEALLRTAGEEKLSLIYAIIKAVLR